MVNLWPRMTGETNWFPRFWSSMELTFLTQQDLPGIDGLGGVIDVIRGTALLDIKTTTAWRSPTSIGTSC